VKIGSQTPRRRQEAYPLPSGPSVNQLSTEKRGGKNTRLSGTSIIKASFGESNSYKSVVKKPKTPGREENRETWGSNRNVPDFLGRFPTWELENSEIRGVCMGGGVVSPQLGRRMN